MVHFTSLLSSLALAATVLAAPLPGGGCGYGGCDSSPSSSPDYNYAYTTSPAMMNEMTSTKMMESTSTMMVESTSTKMMKESTSTMMKESTSTMMMETTTTMMSEPPMTTTTSVQVVDNASTSTMTTATSTMSYGSGYNNWNSGYNDCVQQCMNTYGAPPSMYTPAPSPPATPPPAANTTTVSNSTVIGESTGPGNSIKVIVSPAQGVKRFIPFAVNASVGDTIDFAWGAGPHTVTRSTALTPCNKTLDETNFFASGNQLANFTMNVEVNETDTITYYCGVTGHCPAGMFAFINPPNAAGTPSTVSSMIPSLIAADPTGSLAAQSMYVQNMTAGTDGETWGDHMDMTNVPAELQTQYIQNVWMTKMLYALNPGMLAANLGAANPDGSPVKIPADITQITTGSLSTGGATTTQDPENVGGTATSATPSSTASLGTSGGAKTGGAMSKSVASSGVIGLALLVALVSL